MSKAGADPARGVREGFLKKELNGRSSLPFLLLSFPPHVALLPSLSLPLMNSTFFLFPHTSGVGRHKKKITINYMA